MPPPPGRPIQFVVSPDGRAWIMHASGNTVWQIDHPDPRVKRRLLEAAVLMYGPPVGGVNVDGMIQGTNANNNAFHFWGGPNSIEKILAGHIPDPISGQYISNPRTIRALDGTLFEARTPPVTTPGATPPVIAPGPDATRPPPPDFRQLTRALMPYLPEELATQFADSWARHGDANIAMAELRQSGTYDKWLPGNRRADGSIRMAEADYFSTRAGFEASLSRFGVPPEAFRDRWQELIEGDVSAAEFNDRLTRLYTDIFSQGSDVRRAYQQLYGFTGSDAAIFASAIDGTRSPAEFEFRIRQAQIGGEAYRAGFEQQVDLTSLARLAEFGLTQEMARKFYTEAGELMPRLAGLVQRHNDPDDDFSLDELSDALVFLNPDQRARLEQLGAAEEASFSPAAGAFAMAQTGGVGGLIARGG